MVEGGELAGLGVVREQGDDIGPPAQHVVHEALQGALGAHLDKGAHPGAVEVIQPGHPLHRGGYLALEQVLDPLHAAGVGLAGDVGHQRQPGRRDGQAVQHLAQRPAGGRHDLGVEGVADRQPHRAMALSLEGLHGLAHGFAGAADHELAVAVDVGQHRVAVHLLQRAQHGVAGSEHGDHPAGVVHLHLAHLATPGRSGLQGVGEGHDAGAYQGGVLAQGVPHHHVGLEAAGPQQRGQRGVHGEHGWLGHRRVHQGSLGGLARGRVFAVHEEVVGQRTAQDRGHHLVGRGEDLGHHRLLLHQAASHVQVLAALSRVEEGQLAGPGSAAVEDALGLHGLPQLAAILLQGPARLGEAVLQLGQVAVVDQQAFVGGQRTGGGPGWRRRCRASGQLTDLFVQLRGQVRGCRGSQGQDAPQGRLGRAGLGAGCTGCGLGLDLRVLRVGCRALGAGLGATAGQEPGPVLLEDDVEVGAAEAVGTGRGAPRRDLGLGPGSQLVVQEEGRALEVDARVGGIGCHGGRELLAAQGQHGLQHARRARRGLEVADVGFDRSQRDAGPRRSVEDLEQGLGLHHVAHLGAGAVRLHQGGAGRVQARVLPGAAHGDALADGVGRCDALAPAIAGGPEPADHGVDLVAVALGVGQPLE